jgi:CheY-like chemotaxis protein
MKRPLRILLVEDELIIAMHERRDLELVGCTVVHVDTGEKAAKCRGIHEGSFDLILMDVNLGRGIDGIAAARMIRERSPVPILFLTSHPGAEVLERTADLSRCEYLAKNDFVDFLAEAAVSGAASE